MSKGMPAEHNKPSPAQAALMTAAVTNNGYLTADLAVGRTARTYQACADRGWMTTDHRITFAGRDALCRYDADAYAKALPAAHVDIEINRIAARFDGRSIAPLGGPLGSPAHVLAIPDTWIQYDIEPGSVASFIGYNINTRDGLRTIMDVEYDRNGQGWVDGARIFLSDNKGGIQFTGTVHSEIQVYGPAGSPDLRSNSGKLLDSARKAHEKTLAAAAAHKAATVPHTNPDTDRADTLVTVADVYQLDNAFAGATGATYADRMPARHEDAPGHDFQTSPDGVIEFDGYQLTREQVRAMVDAAAQQMEYRQQHVAHGKTNIFAGLAGSTDLDEARFIPGTTGAGKTDATMWGVKQSGKSGGVYYIGDRAYFNGIEITERVFIGDPKTDHPGYRWPAQRATADTIGSLPTPDQRITMAPNHAPLPANPPNPDTLARAGKQLDRINKAHVNAATYARLAPAVNPGEFRRQVEQIRDAIVARIGNDNGIAGPVDHARYRLRLHYARIATSDEVARDALMKLEIALCEIERGATNIAKVVLGRARRRLNR